MQQIVQLTNPRSPARDKAATRVVVRGSTLNIDSDGRGYIGILMLSLPCGRSMEIKQGAGVNHDSEPLCAWIRIAYQCINVSTATDSCEVPACIHAREIWRLRVELRRSFRPSFSCTRRFRRNWRVAGVRCDITGDCTAGGPTPKTK